ncbi:MAG: hypothetical protein EOS27_14245 [Mesorhizobium sp.]|nr:MAG: hypothetical protein EOS27_14245 [Mesorhizobium sp.]
MMEKASSSVGNERQHPFHQQFDDILEVIDERIAKQEEAVRNMRAALEAEELALERLKLAREPLASKADRPTGRGRDSGGLSDVKAEARRPKGKTTASKVILELAKEAIASASRPLTRSDIVAALEASGTAPASRDLQSLVSKVLWKNRDTFQQVGNGYWLKGHPLPDVQVD